MFMIDTHFVLHLHVHNARSISYAKQIVHGQLKEVHNPLQCEPHHEKIGRLLMKKKAQINCPVTAQLISGFVFAKWIMRFILYKYPNFQDIPFILWVYRPVCVRPGRKS